MYQYNHKFLTTKEHSFNDKEEVICLSSDDEVGRMFLFAKGKSPRPRRKLRRRMAFKPNFLFPCARAMVVLPPILSFLVIQMNQMIIRCQLPGLETAGTTSYQNTINLTLNLDFYYFRVTIWIFAWVTCFVDPVEGNMDLIFSLFG